LVGRRDGTGRRRCAQRDRWLLRRDRERRRDGQAARRGAVEPLVLEHGRDHRVFQRFGLEAGVDAQVRAQIGNANPGQAVLRSKGDHRDQGEQQRDSHGDAEEARERAPGLRRGTHRNSMLGRPAYGNRFRAGRAVHVTKW
jgi:hypothetical protein